MARRIDDLPAYELRVLVESDPSCLPEPGAEAVRDFIIRIGGMQNALLAVEMLVDLEGDECWGAAAE